MKLLRCHIDSFGCLQNFDLEFRAGMTVLQAPNGYGKSTLAAFLRCMFYGMPRGGGDLDKNLRKRYAPWQGGRYGGTLDYTHNGESYRIVRRFGMKSTTGDTLALYALPGMERIARDLQDLGTALFGIDARSFERSTYMQQNAVGVDFDQMGIQARLSNLVEDTDDVAAYDRAVKSLQQCRRELLYQNEKGGRIVEAYRELQEVETALEAAEQAHHGLPARIENLQHCVNAIRQGEKELLTLNDALAEASSFEAAQEKQQTLLRLQKAAVRQQERVAAYEAQCPGGFPEEHEIDAVSAALGRLAQLSVEDSGRTVYARAIGVRESLADRFSDGAPEEATLAALQTQWDVCRRLRAELESLQPSPGEQQRRKTLEQQLSAPIQEVPTEQTALPAGFPLLLLGAGAVLLLLGVVPLVLHKTVVGACLVGLAAIAIGCAAYLNLHRQIVGTREAATVSATLQQRDSLQREFALLQQRAAELERQRSEKQLQLQQQEQLLQNALCRYYPETAAEAAKDGDALLARLRSEAERYRQALETIAAYGQQMRENRDARISCGNAIEAFFEHYMPGAEPGRSALKVIVEAKQGAQQATRDLQEAEAELQRFRDAVGALPEVLTEKRPTEASVAAIRNRIRERSELLTSQRDTLSKLRNGVAHLRERADRLPELQDRQRRLKAQLLDDRERVEVLDQTIAYLAEARKDLAETYLHRIQQGFEAYLKRLAPILAQSGAAVDHRLTIQLLDGGEPRDAGYYSAGYGDILTLCMRLALVDALFEQAEPLVILDDPFVNLDDDNLARGLQLLSDLQQDHQILYLVCSSSRTLGVQE